MPYYSYQVRDKKGKHIKSQTFAMNKQELIKLLQKDELLILSVTESAGIEEKHRRKLHKKVRLRDLNLFAKEMAVLIENGVPLIDAFDIVLKQVESSELLKILTEMKKDLEGGASFRDAVFKHSKVFGSFWYDMIEAGELSGQLPFVMRQIVVFIESTVAMRKKVISAFIYPSLLFIVATLVIFVFVFKVIPIFAGLFSSFGAELPLLTKMVVALSDILRRHFLIIFIIFIAVIFILARAIMTKRGRRICENLFFKTPILGGFLLALSIERFASTLGVLMKSGISIVKALDVAGRASQSLVLSERISEAKVKVMGGLPFSETLEQTGLFPPLPVQLILVAERTGNFSGMLEEISKYYNEIVDTFVTRFTALLEPAVLLFMSVVIGGLVIAMFMPIFKLAGM